MRKKSCCDKDRSFDVAPTETKFLKFLRIFGKCVWLALNLVCAAAMIVSAYNGYISPMAHGGYWGVAGLAFPIALFSVVLFLFIDFFVWRKSVFVPLITLLVCVGPTLNYFPLHIFNGKASDGAKTLKVMTYNVYNFWDLHIEDDIDSPHNRTLYSVIESGADIVCLQETEVFGPIRGNKIQSEDMAKLNEVYPYIIRSGHFVAFLSKYPVDPIHLDYKATQLGGDIGAYRVHIDDETDITFFNLHLQSLGLTSEDFEIYKEMTSGKVNETEIKDMKSEVFAKIAKANVERGQQVQKLKRYIEHYGGPNVVVCGDFNDVANCYSIRQLEGLGLREVYPQVGFGPIVTYNARQLYFGIDHILYRGDLRPLWLKRGHVNSSDHYPLIAEFEIGR